MTFLAVTLGLRRLRQTLPAPPVRAAFADQESFEEAMGFCHSRIVSLNGMAGMTRPAPGLTIDPSRADQAGWSSQFDGILWEAPIVNLDDSTRFVAQRA
jgi:hypothetical protein